MSTPTKRFLPWNVNSVERKVRKVLDEGQEALEAKKQAAYQEEAEKKKKKAEVEKQKRDQHATELGHALLNFKTADIKKADTIRNWISCRGEDLASNLYDGLTQIKNALGKAVKGTAFDNVTSLGSALLGVSYPAFSIRSKRLLNPAEARKGKTRRVTRKELRKRAAEKLSVDDKKAIQAHLQECWKKEKHVSLDTILEWAKSNLGFQYGKTTMSVSRYGWQYKDTSMYQKARLLNPEEPVPGPKKGATRGRRGIVVAVLTVDGVLKGSEQVWVSSGKLEDQAEDYHREMNHVLYEKYMKEKVIPALIRAAADAKRPPVLIIDNAPYHNRYIDKAPTKSDRKGVIADWLTSHGVFVDAKAKKEVLVGQLEKFIEEKGGRSVFKKYVIDEYAKAQGVRVVRLPPYHCFLSPIELLWAQLKQSVMKTGTTSTPLSEVRRSTLEFLRAFSAESSKKLFDKIEKLEREVVQKLRDRNAQKTPSTSATSTSSSSTDEVIQLDDSGDFPDQLQDPEFNIDEVLRPVSMFAISCRLGKLSAMLNRDEQSRSRSHKVTLGNREIDELYRRLTAEAVENNEAEPRQNVNDRAAWLQGINDVNDLLRGYVRFAQQDIERTRPDNQREVSNRASFRLIDEFVRNARNFYYSVRRIA
ncbi:unnamed protein product [Caenorhabditis brenneri]